MLLRLFLLLAFLPVAWSIHESHLSLIERHNLKLDINQKVNLFHPAFLKLVTFGYDSISADLLWLQLIQYYGATYQESAPTTHLYNYFDTITTLDPDFEEAYTFSAYLLDESPEDYKLSLSIMEKGRKNLPNQWEIPFQMAFVYYLKLNDIENAARYFQISGEIPEAPELPLRMAAQLYKRTSKLENCQMSLQLWQINKEKAPTDRLKQKAQRSIIETKITCDLLVLREGLRRYAQQAEKKWQDAVEEAKQNPEYQAPPRPSSFLPNALEQLEQAKILTKMIRKDPLGRPYVYDSKAGTIKVRPLGWRSWDLKAEDFTKQ